MPVFLGYVLAALWLGWLAYWVASSSSVKATARETGWQAQLAYSAPLWAAAFLLVNRHWPSALMARYLPATAWLPAVGILLVAAGLAFAIWARLHLGANWSGVVTVKEDHELVQSGPYAIVRHPIYTGLTLAFIGTAIAVGEWRAVVAVVLAAVSFWYKLRLEERVMSETFGAAYADYSRKVKALIPFVL